MRRFRSVSLALMGLACAFGSSADAGLPGLDSTSHGVPRVKLLGHRAKEKKSGHLCPDCQAKLLAESGQPAPIVISGAPTAIMASGACSACETSAPAGAPIAPSAPGYAVVGDGSPSPVLASASSPPGYASVGGAIASAEPLPIGVVRTNYASPAPAGGFDLHAAPATGGPAAGPIPYAKKDEIPPGMLNGAPNRRPRVLSRMLGLPNTNRMRAESQTRARENHAMTTYGQNAPPSTLPASAVFGR